MEQIRYLLAARRSPPGKGGRAAAPDTEWVTVAKTAIASGTLVLATGLIAMASAATLQIGPFNSTRPANAALPPQIIVGHDPAAAPAFDAAASPASALMLIAEDPGADAWQRMLAGDTVSPHDLSIKLAPLSMTPSLVAIPALAVGLMQASPSLMLSAIRGVWDWTAIAADAGVVRESLFSKAPDPAAAIPAATDTAANTDAPAPATPQPSPPATAKPAPEPKLAQAAPPVATLPQTPPAILPPPTQVTPPTTTPPDPAPPVDAGSGGVPTLPVSPVPEPASWIGFITGFGLIGIARRRTMRRGRKA